MIGGTMSNRYMAILFLLAGCQLLGSSSHSGELPQLEKAPHVIISDWHIGTTMWQLAVLRAIGVPVDVYTRSGHRRYALDDPSFKEDPLFINIGTWSEEKVRQEIAKNNQWPHLT